MELFGIRTVPGIILVFVHLAACTVARYEIRNPLSGGGATLEKERQCEIKYSVVVESASHTNTYGARTIEESRLATLRSKYTTSTKTILSRRPCALTLVEEPEADFKVRVERSLSISALPQEWLTGLSFGLIPSWGTRPNQYAYTFEDTRAKRQHRYIVDETSYNHLVFFPVFWLVFFTLDEFGVYQEALVNFLDGA